MARLSEEAMKHSMDRRSLLKVAGTALGVGVLYRIMPAAAADGEAGEVFRVLGQRNGERPSPFTLVQLSDAHVGFEGPLGTRAFERAVEMVNALPKRPDLVLFTGDLTHDSEDKDAHGGRMKRFLEISRGLNVPLVKHVPGEHDAGLDGGEMYRSFLGESHYSFDHRGVHFIALDNVSRGKPEVGPEQLAWLRRDLARFPRSAPIVVFTHRPLFDLKPEWEWFTSDGDDVMNALAGFENVTVLYGHIHRDDEHGVGGAQHYGARSLVFAFPDPEKVGDRKPIPFDKDQPFKNLGLRRVREDFRGPAGANSVAVEEIELTASEFSGINGAQQLLRNQSL
jgi:3',5'-cyclic AMP phosphodiesterase CpdA